MCSSDLVEEAISDRVETAERQTVSLQVDAPVVKIVNLILVQALKDPRTGSFAVRALGNMGATARGAIPALREFQSQNGTSHSEVEAAIKAIERE